MTTISNAVAEHASERPTASESDRIVLTTAEVVEAARIARDVPDYAVNQLARWDAEGLTVSPRTRKRLELAAALVTELSLAEKPAPRTTVTHSERALPPIQTDSHGDRVLDGDSWGFVWVETPDPSAPADEVFEPHLVIDGIVPESDLDAFRWDADRFVRAIKAPVGTPASWKREVSA